jgi:hypothetical protein
MSTFSSNLYIELIGTGEQTGVWGNTTNTTYQYAFEDSIVGRANVPFTDANVTLTPVALNTSQTFRNVYLNCTGTNTAVRSLIVPNILKNYVIENNTTGGYSILVKTSAGTGITVLNGFKCAVYVDGTNVTAAATYQPSMTIGTLSLSNPLATGSGGTGLSSFTAGDMMYYASGTAFTKLGIGLNGYVLTSNGSAPVWAAQSGLVVTNLAGGAAGSVPYQSAPSTTTFLAAGTTNAVMQISGGIPVWNTSITVPGDSIFSSNGALTISSGTTAQRPVSPAAAMLRFNSTTNEFEGYNGTIWASVGGAALVNDTATATALYPLFASATTGTAQTIYTSNAKLLYTPLSGELKSKVVVSANGFIVNGTTADTNYTIGTGFNAFSVGPITIADGTTITLSAGQTWVVI